MSPVDTNSSTPSTDLPEVSVEVDLNECINYASWQNSVPFLRSLVVCNRASKTLNNVRLELTVQPVLAKPRTWLIDRLNLGDELSISDRNVELDPHYLNGLNEAERGQVTLSLMCDDQLLFEQRHDIRVLARDEWGGFTGQGEIIAAFVMPNDPAIAKILKQAAEALASHGHSSALDGYQSGDPQRAFMLAAAIWSAVSTEGLTYANPPSSFEAAGQKVRRPSTILREGLATCLDSTLLFAAAIEAVGLNPVILFQHGHCFVGTWLVDKTFRNLSETDASEIRKALVAEELITFETTLITHNPPAPFNDAVANATVATGEHEERQFVAVIDIARARMAQIRPLAAHDLGDEPSHEGDAASTQLPLPKAPDFGSSSAEEIEVKPTTPAGRIERWQRKLLDLSLRNRLLNFKFTKQTVPFLCTDVPQLEDRLADGAKIRVVSLPENNPIGDRDAELHFQKTHHNLDSEFAAFALQSNELASPLQSRDLDSRLTELFRKAKNDLSEGGSNTLYLAIGFLKWKRKPDDEQSYRAPLLLVPVKLVRKSALSQFHLVDHEDEVRFNATLIQLMKKDFDRDLSEFEGELPTDNSGVDVPLILNRMRHAVREIPGFEVVDEAALSTFSFAKYLMWKDLVDRIDQLKQNRVVRHLIDNPDTVFQSGVSTAFPQSRDIDRNYSPQELVHPLPADSSQLAAVAAAAEGQDFVLIGPPGTGKSQTIANMIAQCLANGKTVLFVAEKSAALDVVYRRLRAHGLGDYCLELHSNKAERRKFLDQMTASWEAGQVSKADEWLTVNNQLRVRRDELNQYVEALHEVNENGWTVFDAIGVSVNRVNESSPELGWPETVRHNSAAWHSLTDIIDKLALTHGALAGISGLETVQAMEWSMAWEASLMKTIEVAFQSTQSLQAAIIGFAKEIGLSEREDCSVQELESYNRLAKTLITAAAEDYSVIYSKQFAKLPREVEQLEASVGRFKHAEASTVAKYVEDELSQIPTDELEQQWREAVSKVWPFSLLAKRKVGKLLQTYAAEGNADPQRDLSQIRVMQAELDVVANSKLATESGLWEERETDTVALRKFLAKATDLRKSIVSFGKNAGALQAVSAKLAPVVSKASVKHPILMKANQLLTASQQFASALKAMKEVAGGAPFRGDSDQILSETKRSIAGIQAARKGLQRWASWCAIKQRAMSHDLGVFVKALEAKEIPAAQLRAAFELAYVRWWLPKAIDRSVPLRSFARFQHEDAIKQFQRLDDAARSVASSHVRLSLSNGLPSPTDVPRKSELGVLRHQAQLKRPSKTIRQVISAMPESFGKLAPCLLMSPLSISQYLPSDQALFDVVIFDEASQITTWDAIGALARGRQAVIVGDPKQLPPTNFFGRTETDEDNDEVEDHEKDLESILDEATASGLPTMQLKWHYRSSHESLIAFSNWHYYNNELITFPSAVTKDQAVSLKHLPQGVYDRGKSCTNRIEAQTIVNDAVKKMKAWLKDPEDQRKTIGVITFNSQQQSLIQDFFDEAQRKNPEIEWFFADERIEPTVVKNLENVQGDERDVMLFSITFGPNLAGKVPLTFGALNRDGGERRLNVAVTRARQQLVVYSSFKADQLNVEGTKARGVRDLKNFLDYADRGSVALSAEQCGSQGEYDSPFEQAVAEKLSDYGWQVVPQIGVSGFRVDLGVVHPDYPGAYLAGVECDGATYHRSATARDRDKIREQVLRHLGWEILRVWSPDWWYDCVGATEHLDQQLKDLLEASRKKRVAEMAAANEDQQSIDVEQSLEATRLLYETTDLVRFDLNPDAFFADSYTATLRQMVVAVVSTEAPIRDDVLAQRIARAHGFSRTGAKIRERVFAQLHGLVKAEESSGRFIWDASGDLRITDYRYSHPNETRRPIEQVAVAELCGLVVDNREALTETDPALAVARSIGLTRLKASTRARLDEAITRVSEETPSVTS